jgi:hypothetical protein
MTKPPKYPVAAVDETEAFHDLRRADGETPPAGLYVFPSFKHRHEIRPRTGTAEEAYYRAYPQFKPRRLSARAARWHAIRNG